MAEWFEDEHFWIELYPYLFSQDRFENAEHQMDQVLKLVQLHGNAVLDLCCGPGRCALALARRGFAVAGVDRSAFLLEKARALARSQGLEIAWFQQDMRHFVQPQAFDLVLSMFTSFGYFEKKAEDLQVLRNIFASLKPGGVLVMELLGKEILARIFLATMSEAVEDGALLVQRHEITDDWTRVRNEWLLIKGQVAKTFRFDLNIYSAQELKELLRQAGFQKVQVFGNLDGIPYDTSAQRLIVVAEK